MNINNVIIWGDSITKGIVFDDKTNRYTVSAQSACVQTQLETGINIINRSRMGMTVTRGHALMEADLKAGVDCPIALIEFGGNDSDFNWKEISMNPEGEHLSRTPLDCFEAELRSMVKLARSSGIQPVLATLPPINAGKYFEFFSRGLNKTNILSWLGDISVISRYHAMYSSAVSRIAKEEHCPLLDWRSAFAADSGNADLFCTDGIHPSPEGQRLMAKAATRLIRSAEKALP